MTTQTKAADPVLPPLPEPDIGMPGQVKFARSDESALAYGRACYEKARADLIAEIHKRVTDRAVAGALLVKDVRNIIPKE